MGILNWVKWKSSGGPSTEELMKIPLMTERWIGLGFEFPFPDSKFSQLSKLYPWENPSRKEVVMGYTLPALGELGEIKKLACAVDKKTTPPTVLLRFPDRSEGDEELTADILPGVLFTSEYEYLLSPIELIKYQDCFYSIEGILLTVFGLRNMLTREMVVFFFEGLFMNEEPTEREVRKKRLMVLMTDHIVHVEYPLEKRVELFSEHEEAEKWLSEKLFGCSFNEFIDFIMKKEGDSKHMKIYCSEARKLLEKHNIY